MTPMDGQGAGEKTRRNYDETYKRHAVELTLQRDRTVKAVAKELGLPAWLLYDWRQAFAPKAPGADPAPETLEEALKENEQLRGELMRMREREAVLKKSLGILSEPPESGMPRSKR